MNRHARRAAEARARRMRANDRLYLDHIQHLPEVPIDAPYQAGRVYHLCVHHDRWCRFYDRGLIEECDCNPVVTRHVEPVRQ